jgi:hypothetical protein
MPFMRLSIILSALLLAFGIWGAATANSGLRFVDVGVAEPQPAQGGRSPVMARDDATAFRVSGATAKADLVGDLGALGHTTN